MPVADWENLGGAGSTESVCEYENLLIGDEGRDIGEGFVGEEDGSVREYAAHDEQVRTKGW